MADNNLKPADLANKYITAIIEILEDKAKINKAVETRGIIIEDPSTKGKNDNNATLDTIEDQFDLTTGNRKAQGATFTYHEPDRRDRETNRYLSEELSDREKIALASVYFTAAVAAKKGYEFNPDAIKHIDAIQVHVANELRKTKVFETPLSYKITKDFADKMQTLKTRTFTIGQITAMDSHFKDELQAAFYKISLQKKAILKHGGTTNPANLKGNDADKYKILSVITAAIDRYGQDYDITKVSVALTNALDLDKNRKKGILGTHHTSELIQKIADLVNNEIKNRATPAASPTESTRASLSGSKSQTLFHHSTSNSISLNDREQSSSTKKPK